MLCNTQNIVQSRPCVSWDFWQDVFIHSSMWWSWAAADTSVLLVRRQKGEYAVAGVGQFLLASSGLLTDFMLCRWVSVMLLEGFNHDPSCPEPRTICANLWHFLNYIRSEYCFGSNSRCCHWNGFTLHPMAETVPRNSRQAHSDREALPQRWAS